MPPTMPNSEASSSSPSSSKRRASPSSTSTKSRSTLAFWNLTARKSRSVSLPLRHGSHARASSKPSAALVRSHSFTIKRHSYRVILLGDARVGKTALRTDFVQGFFAKDYEPTIEDSFTKQFVVDKGPVLLEVLDTGGHAEFATLRSSYIDSGDGYLLVFDVTNRESFEHLRDYLREVRVAKDDDDVPLILVANKCDVKGRQVTREEIVEIAAYFGVPVVETSVRKQWHVHEMFHEIVRLIRRQEWRRQEAASARVAKQAKDRGKEKRRGSGTRSCTIF